MNQSLVSLLQCCHNDILHLVSNNILVTKKAAPYMKKRKQERFQYVFLAAPLMVVSSWNPGEEATTGCPESVKQRGKIISDIIGRKTSLFEMNCKTQKTFDLGGEISHKGLINKTSQINSFSLFFFHPSTRCTTHHRADSMQLFSTGTAALMIKCCWLWLHYYKNNI